MLGLTSRAAGASALARGLAPVLGAALPALRAALGRAAFSSKRVGGGGEGGLDEVRRAATGSTAGAETTPPSALRSQFDLSGRKALVTGAARGMGAWCAGPRGAGTS